MNVLYIAPFASPSFIACSGDNSSSGLGGSRKVSLIAQAIAQQGHQLVLLSSIVTANSQFAWRGEIRENQAFGSGCVTVVYPSTLTLRPIGGILNCLRAASFIDCLLTEFKPDAAIVYNTYLFESLALKELVRLRKIPIVLEVEDLPLARYRGWLNPKPWLDQRCWGGTVHQATGFTAVNGHILAKLPKDRPKYLLPGVIDDQLAMRGRSRLPLFRDGQKTLGYFGGLEPEKGVQILIDLVPRLPHDWRLVVTGSGSLASKFESLGKQYPGQLTFLGRVSTTQLYDAMCSCDCTVIPREQINEEGVGVFPFKTLEFIVAGTHVIACGLPSLTGLDLSFIQRWDGISVDSLLTHLAEAETAYVKEQSVRSELVKTILGRYSLNGITRLFCDLFASTKASPSA